MTTTKIINKAFKFRIYPNAEQREMLAKHFGHCRFVYNHFLAERIAFYKANKDAPKGSKKGLNYQDNAKELTKLKKASDTVWLKAVNSQSLQASLKNLDTAYQGFFRAVKSGNKKGFPKFKSKHNRQSFSVPQRFELHSFSKPVKTLFGTKSQSSGHSWLKIPNLPKSSPLLKVKAHRKIPDNAKVLFVTISKTTTEKYFASLTCELEITPKVQPTPSEGQEVQSLGIDLGLSDLVICSDGVRFANSKPLKRSLKKLKYAQRQLSKKQKKSTSRNKARLKLARIHEKVSNVRKDYLHKISHQLIGEQTIVCMESLKVKNMVKNHRLAQAISDASWGEFGRQLHYKAEWHRRVVVQVDQFFASSKTCSCCGHKLGELPLRVRKWQCPQCDEVHDRDINAAINIEKEGLRILKISSGGGLSSDAKQKQVEALSLGESVKPEASRPR